MQLFATTVSILGIVFVHCVISSGHHGHEHCLESECICEGTRLMCNPHHLEEDQWEVLHEIPTALHERNLPTFEEADFRYNKIDAVKSNSFQGLHNLDTLWLSHNQVSTVETNAFNKAAALNSIDLSYNKLESIKTGMFSSVPLLLHLHTIDLSHNRITLLEPGCFKATPKLKELYLHNNPLTYLSDDSFDDLHMLSTLSLAHSSPREAHELMAILEPLTSLRLIFIDGIVENCTCAWMDTLEMLKTRNVDIMDENHVMAHCIETWRSYCDVSHIHRLILEELRHHRHHSHEITVDDIQPPVVRGNGTLVFPDGSEFQLNSVEGKRALYQYDRITHERIKQIKDESKRKSYEDMFKQSMTNFIRMHYVLNGIEGAGGNMTLSELSPADWMASSSSKSLSKPAGKTKKRKMKTGMPTSYIWLILGGLGCGLLVVFLVALQQIDWRDHTIKDPEKEKRKRKKKEEKKCCGWFGTITGKLNVRNQFVKGTVERKHAKQKFAQSAKNNFAVLHGQAKEKMDRIQEEKHQTSENFGHYTSPSNHIVPSPHAPPNLGRSGEHPANLGPPQAPPIPPTGLRRTSLDEGIRNMVASQRTKMTGGQTTPSEGSAYHVGNFYSDSEDDDEDECNEETDLFRR